MNELQQILIVFAIIVIVGLYLLQKRKNKSATTPSTSSQSDVETSQSPSSKIKTNAGAALNELGDAHIPVSDETNHRLHLEDEVPENQLGLSFGEGFEASKSEPVIEEPTKTARHIVIEAEDVTPVDGFVPEANGTKPSFGVPKEPSPMSVEISQQKDNVEKTEPQVFVLIVMGTEEFLWPKVNQTLQGVGLSPSENNIFAKKDSMGNEIIRVANLLEPGVFPVDEPTNNEFKTPGVVLILELPTTVKAPAVMHDMIMMARKISQRLNGRLYNGERHLIKESDLQQMRDEAVAYESRAI